MENNEEKQDLSKIVKRSVDDTSNSPVLKPLSTVEKLGMLEANSALSLAIRGLNNRKDILNTIQPNSALLRAAQGLSEHQDIIKKAIQTSSSLPSALQVLRDHQSAIKSAMQPSLAIQDSIRQLYERPSAITNAVLLNAQLGGVHEAMNSFRTHQDVINKYILPDVFKINEIIKSIQPSPAMIALSQNVDRVYRAAESMHNPWLNSINSAASLKAFAELQSIGSILSKTQPFSDDLVNPLRTSLGDWRDKIEWPKNIFTSLEAKSSFYEGLGYDQDLVDFPDPAFEEALEIAGIGQSTPTLIDIYGNPIPPSDNVEEENGFKRTNKAHDLLFRLESHVRRFIHEKMLQSFGQHWVKQQIPDPILKAWKAKMDAYQKSHPTPQDMHIIEFADFSDYVPIIIRRDNWNAVFKLHFQRTENVTESFQRLYPIRLDTMHARPISRSDELLLLVETERLYKACNL